MMFIGPVQGIDVPAANPSAPAGPGDDAGVLGPTAGGQARPQARAAGRPAQSAGRLGADRPAGRAGRARSRRDRRRHPRLLQPRGARSAGRSGNSPGGSIPPGRSGSPGRAGRPATAATSPTPSFASTRCLSGWLTSRWPPSTTTGPACGWSGAPSTARQVIAGKRRPTAPPYQPRLTNHRQPPGLAVAWSAWVSLDAEGLHFPFSPSRSRSSSPTSWLTGPREPRSR